MSMLIFVIFLFRFLKGVKINLLKFKLMNFIDKILSFKVNKLCIYI